MTEIFTNVTETFKRQAKNIIDFAFYQDNFLQIMNIVDLILKLCHTEEEREFIDFYFNMKLEEMRNEE